jgi:hypothetical protein
LELVNKSANQLKQEQVKGITLVERLLLEFAYFLATDEHLDGGKSMTLCSGSRWSNGDVPSVRWLVRHRAVYVHRCNPDFARPSIGTRGVACCGIF